MDMQHFILIAFAAACSTAASVPGDKTDLEKSIPLENSAWKMAGRRLVDAQGLQGREKRSPVGETLLTDGGEKAAPKAGGDDAVRKLKSSEEEGKGGASSSDPTKGKEFVTVEMEPISTETINVYDARTSSSSRAETADSSQSEEEEAVFMADEPDREADDPAGGPASILTSLWGKIVKFGKIVFNAFVKS